MITPNLRTVKELEGPPPGAEGSPLLNPPAMPRTRGEFIGRMRDELRASMPMNALAIVLGKPAPVRETSDYSTVAQGIKQRGIKPVVKRATDEETLDRRSFTSRVADAVRSGVPAADAIRDAFEEGKHPRASNGQFGGGGAVAKSPTKHLRIEMNRGSGWETRSEGHVPSQTSHGEIMSQLKNYAIQHPHRALVNGEVVGEHAPKTRRAKKNG